MKLRELEREATARRSVYEAFLLRSRETNEQEGLNTANVRVLSEARPPLDPAGTSRKLFVIAGLIAGFLAGLDYSRPQLRTAAAFILIHADCRKEVSTRGTLRPLARRMPCVPSRWPGFSSSARKRRFS